MKHLRRIVAGGVPTGQEFSAIFFSQMQEWKKEIAEKLQKIAKKTCVPEGNPLQ